jgi:hypothetical protein
MRPARQAVRDAERRFPVRIRIAVPPEGFGSRLDQIFAWLDANCGSDGWTPTPSSTRGVINDALALYFADVTLASAFAENSRMAASCPAGRRRAYLSASATEDLASAENRRRLGRSLSCERLCRTANQDAGRASEDMEG